MNKGKLIFVVIITIVLFILVSSYLIFTFIFGQSPQKIEAKFYRNDQSFNQFVAEFLNQNEIRNMGIKYGLGNHLKIINNCSYRLDKENKIKFECLEGKYPNESFVYFDNIDEVLKYQKIEMDTYLKTYNFLKKYGMDGIGKDDKVVDIESGLNGLRYYIDKNQAFSEDDEYIYVKKINDNWYVFTRDWN